jgi:tetratricopeptide (TPR) repeat protein
MASLLLPYFSQEILARRSDSDNEVFDRILDLHERIQKSDAGFITVDMAGSYTIIAMIYQMRGNQHQVEESTSQAINILERYGKFGDEAYYALPTLYYLRSTAQSSLGEKAAALHSAERAVSVGRQFTDRSALQFGASQVQYLKHLAQLQEKNALYAEARETLDELAMLQSKLPAPESKRSRERQQAEASLGRVHAYHILLKDRDAALAIIEKLNQSRNLVEDFQSYARQYSVGPSGPAGGDLGWFGPGVMVKDFEDAVFRMNPGEFSSEPVETQYGWHVIYLSEKQRPGAGSH